MPGNKDLGCLSLMKSEPVRVKDCELVNSEDHFLKSSEIYKSFLPKTIEFNSDGFLSTCTLEKLLKLSFYKFLSTDSNFKFSVKLNKKVYSLLITYSNKLKC